MTCKRLFHLRNLEHVFFFLLTIVAFIKINSDRLENDVGYSIISVALTTLFPEYNF